MPFYRALAKNSTGSYPFTTAIDAQSRVRTAEGLLRIRDQFKREVPRRSLNDSLLLATWNIREFDAGAKSDFRSPESIFYIAEILSHFDLIAVQEVRENLASLDKVMSVLGPWWKYIVTDVTYGASGNGERMAFVYDGRKVDFAGLAGEVVLPGTTKKPEVQLARTPFICGFKAHWSRFNLCTVHIYYGESKPDDPRRLTEVEKLAGLLAKYVAGPPSDQPGAPKTRENLILLGDFNIFKATDKTMKAMTDQGFTVPDELIKRPGSNLDQSKFYDQIAFRVQPDRFETTGKAGVLDFTKSVYRMEDETIYVQQMSEARRESYLKQPTAAKKTSFYKDWRTYQMSDHLVLWVELKIDFGREYLEEAAGRKALPTPNTAGGEAPPVGQAGATPKRPKSTKKSASKKTSKKKTTKKPVNG